MMMQMVASYAEFERAMIRERTSAGLAAARAEGRVGGRRQKLDAVKRKEIAKSVISGRRSGAEMVRLYSISSPTVSRIVAHHRNVLAWCTVYADRLVTPPTGVTLRIVRTGRLSVSLKHAAQSTHPFTARCP
jgi:DNA invertase Pin-like site-specific DNA recombinase